MARPVRLEFEGALYHVTSRGDRREDIYETDEDRLAFLGLLGAVCDRCNWVCHAYCLMGNHYHILVETPDANLSRGMRQLNGVYTRKFNVAHGRVGHVFQGRYKAIVVDADKYLMELARYIVLNPVRAKMVGRPEEWPWSSYVAMGNRRAAPDWLEVDGMLAYFGENRRSAVSAYRRFVMAGIGQQSPWGQLKGQIYLGGEQFLEAMQHRLDGQDDSVEFPRAQRRPKAKSLEYYDRNSSSHKDAMRMAYASGGFTLQAIAAYFGVHYSTVSRAVNELKG
ncbi:MAG: transposase [Proteobacteria bacterium]|nr:transposase [Pseudomonadota bacterium]